VDEIIKSFKSMSRFAHKIYILTLTTIALVVLIYLGILGGDYYTTAFSERFFHAQNDLLKSSGLVGHGAGIVGSLLMITGVFGYMIRKRVRFFSRLGVLKHWLEFHIFLCSLGPILVLYHTAFKFGGLVAISFWSMVAVVFSGIIGRFIYLQIPRTIEGRVLSLNELNIKRATFNENLQKEFGLDSSFIDFLNQSTFSEGEMYKGTFFSNIITRIKIEKEQIRNVKKELKNRQVPKGKQKKIIRFIRAELVLARRIAWLSTMQNYLRYWHVLHLPFAIIMLVIMIVHVIVAVLFGYTWIF
jgi:hypothetical protein